MFAAIVLVLFFLSGATGLLYEVVWTRIFGLIYGNTTLALSTVLAAFMLGLAGGSMMLGRVARRLQYPLRTYALLELGVAVTALLVPLLHEPLAHSLSKTHATLERVPAIFQMLQFALAFLVMLPATFFMGGTLPVLSQAVVQEQHRVGVGVGRLYGANTLGAMLGCFLTGFVFIRVAGVSHSLHGAIATNLLIAAVAGLLARGQAKMVPVAAASAPPVPWEVRARMVLVVMALSGFAALSYEVLWTRVLVFVLTNSVYAMAVMLTTILCGLGVGAALAGRWADRTRQPLTALGFIQIALGFSALLAAALLANLSWIHDRLFTLGPTTTWWHWNGIRFGEAFLVMFVPALFMGASFPFAARIAVPRVEVVGERVGLVYFYNTLGGVAGSFLTGFVLVQVWGTSASLAAMVSLNVLLGLYLLLSRLRAISWQWNSACVLAGAALLLLVVRLTPPQWFTVAYAHVEKDFTLVDYREGIEGTVTIHEQRKPFQTTRRMDVDGLNVAGTSFMLKTLQTLQGHLPLCVHPRPQTVLQIGFGTGQTSKCALRHPLQEFHLVEISPDVLTLSGRYFAELNEGVLQHPRFTHSIRDGKNYVRHTTRQYDLILNDANYAVATASASLFTREHFENCRNKLRPGGLVSTWMTIDLDPVDFAVVLKTFQSVFPYCALWMAPNCLNKQVVLMGAEQPWQISWQRLEALFADPAIRRDFESINITSVYDFLDGLMLDHHGIAAISATAEINSDNHPVLEFSTRDIRSRDYCAYLNLGKVIFRRPNVAALLADLPHDPAAREAVQVALARHAEATRLLLQGLLEAYQGHTLASLNSLLAGSRLIPESNLAREFFERADLLSNQLLVAAAQAPGDRDAQLNLVRHWIALHRYDDAMLLLRPLARRFPGHPLVLYEWARVHLGRAQADSAAWCLEQALAVQPRFAGALYALGEIHRQAGHWEQALALLARALELDPRMYEVHNAQGRIYQRQHEYARALACFEQSLALMEYQPAIVAEVAACHAQLQAYPRALEYYHQALAMGLSSAEVFLGLGNVHYLMRAYAQAGTAYGMALQRDSSNAVIHYNLGNALMMQRNISAAAAAYRRAVHLNPDEPDYFNNLALSYRELGRTAEARRVFEQALARHPNSRLLQENYRGLLRLH